ncbi:hypothetical protein SAMN04487897_10617 [Paenibacillus sp. yr247]|uniref:hypothetical protein n=1 Tax=Paenibacillus sp. yr247 TaxID=1761880 RepID=UPI000890EAC5|nr:hypothetical protein [Paenibacillus sp. yr247]SDN92579.1 hypothetical protein SAMN04487897_10617 [Paenibacillus sp. yr247]
MTDKDIFLAVVVSFLVFVLLYLGNIRFLPKRRKKIFQSPVSVIMFSTIPWFLTGLLTPHLGWLITGIIVGMVLLWILTVFPVKHD